MGRTARYKLRRGHIKNSGSIHENLLLKKDTVLNNRPLKITAIYLIFGILWILFSDRITHVLSPNIDTEALIQTIKGWLFVIATGVLIFGLLTRLLNEIKRLFDGLIESYEEKEAIEEELRQNYNELQNKERLLSESYERYDLALTCSNDIIWEWDIAANKLIFSDKIRDYFDNETMDENVDEFVNTIVMKEDRDGALEAIRKHLNGENDFYKDEYRILNKNGQYIWMLSSGKAIRDANNKPVRMLGSLKDINERKKYEENLYRLAYYDSLTGLTNRKYFLKELNNMINQEETCSVLYIDIDDFKKVNDIRGHDFGDELLRFTSNQLNSIIGEKDLVSRASGDEFLILLRNIKDDRDIFNTCEDIICRFKKSLEVSGKSIYTSLSIGVSKYPYDGEDTNTILKKADIAMYKAKTNGKNCYAVFDRTMGDELIRKVDIEKYLRRADFDDEFEIYYQPQVNINKNELIGLEALIRWTNKELGRVSPAEFIPVAEETGLIDLIGDWVLRHVCGDCSKWASQGYKFNKVSVNISVKQLQNREFYNRVNEIIEEMDVKPEYLKFEITESVLMNNFNNNIELINSFKNKGIQIALDDFGTGYSSINYLRKLPFNTLKIDKAFIDNIEESVLDREIIKEIINLSNNINVDVIVEGVEQEGQVQVLRQIGCNQIQGYYFSKPLPLELTEELLRNTIHN